MTIEEIKEDAVRFENLARAYYIRAIQAYLSKFKRKLHAADKLAGYSEIFDDLENQSLNKLKLTFAKIVESKVLDGEEI